MPKAGYADWDEDEALDLYDERPTRRVRRRSLPWLRLIVLSAVSVAGLVYFAQQKQTDESSAAPKGVPASVLIAPAPAWKPVSPSPAVYGLDKGWGPVTLEARQHTNGAREDTLILGRFGETPHARITLAQGSAEPARSFFVDIVRRAAGAGLAVARDTQGRVVATKFGFVEAASVTFAGPVETTCQAFRFSDRRANFGFQGWLCAGEAHADDEPVACFIDAITVGGGASPDLKALFARAGQSRATACTSNGRTASLGLKPAPRR